MIFATKQGARHVHYLTLPRLGNSSLRLLQYQLPQGAIHFKIKVRDRLIHCPHCQSRDIIHKGKVTRILKTLPIGSKPVFIELEVPRITCLKCQLTRQIKLIWERGEHIQSFVK